MTELVSVLSEKVNPCSVAGILLPSIYIHIYVIVSLDDVSLTED